MHAKSQEAERRVLPPPPFYCFVFFLALCSSVPIIISRRSSTPLGQAVNGTATWTRVRCARLLLLTVLDIVRSSTSLGSAVCFRTARVTPVRLCETFKNNSALFGGKACCDAHVMKLRKYYQYWKTSLKPDAKRYALTGVPCVSPLLLREALYFKPRLQY